MTVKDTVIISLMGVALLGYTTRVIANYLNRIENDVQEGIIVFFVLLILTVIFL